MNVMIVLLLCLQLTQAVTHSLQYFYTTVREIYLPEFTAVGVVDGEEFTYYDSMTKSMIPKTEWIKKFKGNDPHYWGRTTQMLHGSQEMFKVNLDTLMQRFNQTKGVHIVQWMYGCELDDDGTIRGYDQFGYDGEDFISLDLKTLTWTAANPKAQITKLKLDSTGGEANYIKNYLEKECVDWLKKFISYRRETLEKRVPPEVQVFQQQGSSSSELVCHATGFFPQDVRMLWQKEGEEVKGNVEVRETLPNQDGSFQKRIILRVSPETLLKNKYTCVIQHSSLKEELRKELKDPIGMIRFGVGLVVVTVVIVMALVLLLNWVIWIMNKIIIRKRISGFFGTILQWFRSHLTENSPVPSKHNPKPSDSEYTSEKPEIRVDLVKQSPALDQMPQSEQIADFDKLSVVSGLFRSPSDS